MKFNKAKLLPLVIKLGDYLKQGFDHYVELKASGVEVDPDLISAFISTKMEDWSPQLNGKDILDPDTKEAAVRFVSGVAFNMAN